MRRLAAGILCAAAALAAAAPLPEKTAPKPLFRDPVFDGAADPSIVYSRAEKKWLMFYTNRRANVPGLPGVSWVHGTPIGVAESSDGADWKYRGTVAFPADIPGAAGATPTFWAPAVRERAGVYHMFVTVVPGVFTDWQHPRSIVHLTSPDLKRWRYEGTLPLASDKVIDPCVLPLPDGTWRLWYNNERAGKSICFADSPDLHRWTDRGAARLPGNRGEAPLAFVWQGHTWLVIDLLGNSGLGVFRSDDGLTWERQPARLLDRPGTGPDDQNGGHHPEVIVSGERAFLFYFVHPGQPDLKRSSIQVVELHYADGWLTCDREAPTNIRLLPPE